MVGVLHNATETQVPEEATDLGWEDVKNIFASISIAASPEWKNFANTYDADHDISNGLQVFTGYNQNTPEQQAYRLLHAARDYRKINPLYRQWLDQKLFNLSRSRLPDTVIHFNNQDHSLAKLLTDDDQMQILAESLRVYSNLKNKTALLEKPIDPKNPDSQEAWMADELHDLCSESLDVFVSLTEELNQPVEDDLASAITTTVDRMYDCGDIDFCLDQLDELVETGTSGTLEDYYKKISSLEYHLMERGITIPLEERVGFQRVPNERFKQFLLQNEVKKNHVDPDQLEHEINVME